VAGLGTSGTFVGTTRRLKELNSSIHAISVQPDAAFHGLEGLKHMASAIVPGIYDSSLADSNLEIETEAAYKMVKRIAQAEGVLLGISSGAALEASLQLARQIADQVESAVIVTILPDSADKYLSEAFWNQE
jgi:cysteine synthase B